MSTRTTLTLDDGLQDRLKRESRSRGLPFRRLVNDLLRAGLLVSQTTPPRRRFRIKPRRMGVYPSLDYNNVSGLIAFAEGEDYR